MIADSEYEHTQRVCYNDGMQFIPVRPNCGSYVKADNNIKINQTDGQPIEPNATCYKCGRVRMIFEGYF